MRSRVKKKERENPIDSSFSSSSPVLPPQYLSYLLLLLCFYFFAIFTWYKQIKVTTVVKDTSQDMVQSFSKGDGNNMLQSKNEIRRNFYSIGPELDVCSGSGERLDYYHQNIIEQRLQQLISPSSLISSHLQYPYRFPRDIKDFVIKPSHVHGRGVFTTKDYKVGQWISVQFFLSAPGR